MRYPAYAKYRGSGIDWLGRLPAHWKVGALRWFCRRYAGGTPDRANDSFWHEGTIPWINSGAVNQGLVTEPSAYITEEGFAGSSTKWIPAGALVMALAGQGKTKGTVAQLGIRTTCNQSIAAIVPDERMKPRFLFWYLCAHYEAIRNLAGGEARDGLNLDILGSLPVPLLPATEQLAIAGFLDRKTAEIDGLIATKRSLIEKLNEKRSALISATVTRGLPPKAASAAGFRPNPEMVPTDSEALSQIPSHWKFLRVATVAAKITNGFVGPTRDILVSDGVRYLQSLHIKDNRILFQNDYFVEPEWSREHSKSILREGDVLVVQTGDIGQVAFVPAEFAGCNCHALIILTPRVNRITGQFLSLLLNSFYGFHELKRIQTGALHPHLNCGLVRDVRIPVPPLPEQHAIVDFLDVETMKIDELVSNVNQAIERLQEYRTALVTAAVTGKIDVRQGAYTLSTGAVGAAV